MIFYFLSESYIISNDTAINSQLEECGESESYIISSDVLNMEPQKIYTEYMRSHLTYTEHKRFH